MAVLFTGSFYRITYSQWKTNPRITAFVLYAGPQGNKTHLLNLSAVQLSTIDRIKLIQVLKRLITASKTQTFTGRQLYRMLKQYCPGAIRSCYRTMFRQYITSYALVNYGLNSQEFFENNKLLLQGNNKQLYDLANREILIKSLNFITGKGAQFSFAKPVNTPPATPATGTIKPVAPKFFTPTIKPLGTTPTTSTQNTNTNNQNTQENTNNDEEDNNIF